MDKVAYIDPNLPLSNQMELINKNLALLQGAWESQNVDKLELDYLHQALSRKWKRSIGIGNTLGTYTGWTHFKAEAGYSIWKYVLSDFAYNADNKLYFDGKSLEYRGQAQTESDTSFSHCWSYDSTVPIHVDLTSEISTEGAQDYNYIHRELADFFYIGHTSTFAGMDVELSTYGSGYTTVVEYSKGSGQWGSVIISDDTQGFIYSGKISFTPPGDWAQDNVNGQTKYWVRFSTTTVPTIRAYVDFIKPIDTVAHLLALSQPQYLTEQWAWCSIGTSVYVAIRNAGNSLYEGDYYITSASSSANKENFFVYNHQITADYVDSAAPANPFQVITTASLPAAGASQDGRIIIEDGGAGDRNLIIYTNGQRFRIDGGAPF